MDSTHFFSYAPKRRSFFSRPTFAFNKKKATKPVTIRKKGLIESDYTLCGSPIYISRKWMVITENILFALHIIIIVVRMHIIWLPSNAYTTWKSNSDLYRRLEPLLMYVHSSFVTPMNIYKCFTFTYNLISVYRVNSFLHINEIK